jgi:hypothetical protein
MSLLTGVQSYEDLKDTSLWVPVANTAMDMISAWAYIPPYIGNATGQAHTRRGSRGRSFFFRD